MDKKLSPKQYAMIAVIYAAIFAIYNIIVMLAFDNKNNIFWISYGFVTVGLIINIAIALITFKTTNVEAAFMGIPLMSFSVFYVIAELFAGIVFMLFRSYVSMELTLAVQAILLLLFVIFAVVALLARNAVESITHEIESKVSGIKSLSVDVKVLSEQCMDSELKAELHKIAEAIRYSDPMTNNAVADLDNMISSKVSELKYQCNQNNKDEAMQICYRLGAYISERNQKLILTK